MSLGFFRFLITALSPYALIAPELILWFKAIFPLVFFLLLSRGYICNLRQGQVKQKESIKFLFIGLDFLSKTTISHKSFCSLALSF